MAGAIGGTHFRDAAMYVAALIFRGKIGGLVNIIGPVTDDSFVGCPRRFGTVIAHDSQGFLSGLGTGRGLVLQVSTLILSRFVMSSI